MFVFFLSEMASRLSSYLRRAQPRQPFKMPERLKGGRIERYVTFWQNLARDYKEAGQEIVAGAKAKPLKASIYGTILGLGLYANKHNPDEQSFRTHLINTHLDLTMVPHSNMNPKSTSHQHEITRCMNAGLLRFWNFGIFTLIWRDNYSLQYGHVKANCKYLQTGYLDVFTQGRIVDIGFLDRWWLTEQAMTEYDVNPGEWDERGSPIDPKGQLKKMW